MATIHLENVTRLFAAPQADAGILRAGEATSRSQGGSIAALDRVTLTIPDGETCSVIGPSGCGKSTLLRVVAGLDTEYTGDVYYDDQDMRDVAPGKRNIGMVFQNYALYPHFQGVGNLRFFFRIRRAPDAEAEERIRITSEIMGYGFDQLLAHKPGTLSGGEQQRLAIARALVREPDLFLFDEPLSNLDAKLRMQTRVEIKRLLQRFAITSIYVTHDQEEAIALGGLIAVMRAGRIEQVGAYHELHSEPANTFVAGFLGRHPMNLLEGTVMGEGILHLGGNEVPMPPALGARYHRGQTLQLGVWPEALSFLTTLSEGSGGAILNGQVDAIEPDFSRHTQYVRVHTEAGMVTVADTSGVRLAVDERVAVLLPYDSLHFFEVESGRRIAVDQASR